MSPSWGEGRVVKASSRCIALWAWFHCCVWNCILFVYFHFFFASFLYHCLLRYQFLILISFYFLTYVPPLGGMTHFSSAWIAFLHTLKDIKTFSLDIKSRYDFIFLFRLSSVQSLSHVWLVASLSIINSWSLLKLMSIKSVMPSNHLILCRPLLHHPSIFPSIRGFSNEPVDLSIPPRSGIYNLGPLGLVCWPLKDQTESRISSQHTCEWSLLTSHGFLCAWHQTRCPNDSIIDRHIWGSRAEAAADPSAHSIPKDTVFFFF